MENFKKNVNSSWEQQDTGFNRYSAQFNAKKNSTPNQLNKVNYYQELPILLKTLSNLKSNRCYLIGRFKGKYITKREAECALCLIHGFTTKQIAEVLSISARTVESLLQNLKKKMFCYDKIGLIDSLMKGGFVKFIYPLIKRNHSHENHKKITTSKKLKMVIR